MYNVEYYSVHSHTVRMHRVWREVRNFAWHQSSSKIFEDLKCFTARIQ